MYFYLKDPKATKDTPIYISYRKLNYKYATGLKIHPEFWNFEVKTPILKRGRSDLKKIALKLNQYSEELTKFVNNKEFNNELFDKDDLKFHLDSVFKRNVRKTNEKVDLKKSIYLTDMIRTFITSRNKSHGQSKSWNQKYQNLHARVSFFELYKNKRIELSSLNDNFIDEYCGFLRSIKDLLEENDSFNNRVTKFCKTNKIKYPQHNYNDNTLSRHINFLTTSVKWYSNATKNNIYFKNPVKEYEPEDVHLTEKEILLLENLKLKRAALIRVRDIFLVGIYSGQRFSDYSVFEKSDLVKTNNGEMIIKKAEKTENESYIPIIPKLRKILDKYDWKLPRISSQKFNNHLTEICYKAGIDDEFKKSHYKGNEKWVTHKPKYEYITSHTARRTFITLSAEKGMPDHIIMKITGIRDIKTLQKYKKTSQNSIAESMMKIWG